MCIVVLNAQQQTIVSLAPDFCTVQAIHTLPAFGAGNGWQYTVSASASAERFIVCSAVCNVQEEGYVFGAVKGRWGRRALPHSD